MEENEVTGGAAEQTANEEIPADAGRETNEAEDLDAEFERLIKGRYRDSFAKRTQAVINRRFREMKELEEFRDKALGERDESERRRRAGAALGVASEYSRLIADAKRTKESYPAFDLERECRDGAFLNLVKSGLSVMSAYEALHHGEIVEAAAQAAARSVAEAARRGSAHALVRPEENATAKSSPSNLKSPVSSLTAKEIKEILRRVERGEKIKF